MEGDVCWTARRMIGIWNLEPSFAMLLGIRLVGTTNRRHFGSHFGSFCFESRVFPACVHACIASGHLHTTQSQIVLFLLFVGLF